MPPAKGEPGYRSNSVHCSYNPIEVPWAADLCCYEDVPGCRGGKCATARQLLSPLDHCGDLARTFVSPWATTRADTADPEPKRVLILHSVGREFRPWNEYAKNIRAELDRQSSPPVDVQEHSLVPARSGDPKAEALFLDYIRALYADAPPDLVISIGAPSAAFFQRHRQQLFPTSPILFTVLEQRRVQYRDLTNNDTVVAVKHDFRALFESFLGISPDTKVIAIINGSSPNERFWQDEMRRELQPLDGRIEIRWYDELSFEEVLKRTA